MKIAYGIIATDARRDTLLPRTIASLAAAGFDEPRLFVDGSENSLDYWHWPVTTSMRGIPAIGNFGNWYLGLAELYARNPHADRFLMFEDDIVCVRGLREYLERTPMPAGGYCNLYTGGERNPLLAAMVPQPFGWFESDQRASGALALMFDNKTAIQLLGSEVFVRSRQNENTGDHRIDGAICLALRSDPRRHVLEYCHQPGLVQHTGAESSLLDVVRRQRGLRTSDPAIAVSRMFPGEEFDVRSLL